MMSLEDKLAIQEVMAQYSYTYDARDAEGFAALFTEDAVWELFAAGATHPEIRLTSRAAIRAWAAQEGCGSACASGGGDDNEGGEGAEDEGGEEADQESEDGEGATVIVPAPTKGW